MARAEKIFFVFELDPDGKVEKLLSSRIPHAGAGGDFHWELTNRTGRDIDVKLDDFANPNRLNVDDFLEFTPRNRSRRVTNNDSETIRGKIIRVNDTNVPFKYKVYVNGTPIDPELIVDGGGGHLPGDPNAKKEGKKKK